jgi:hypothetical protein
MGSEDLQFDSNAVEEKEVFSSAFWWLTQALHAVSSRTSEKNTS